MKWTIKIACSEDSEEEDRTLEFNLDLSRFLDLISCCYSNASSRVLNVSVFVQEWMF